MGEKVGFPAQKKTNSDLGTQTPPILWAHQFQYMASQVRRARKREVLQERLFYEAHIEGALTLPSMCNWPSNQKDKGSPDRS